MYSPLSYNILIQTTLTQIVGHVNKKINDCTSIKNIGIKKFSLLQLHDEILISDIDIEKNGRWLMILHYFNIIDRIRRTQS